MGETKNIPLSTGALPPAGAVELGLVHGEICISKNIIRDTTATIRNATIGGELTTYTELMTSGIKTAIERMTQMAIENGADGVYGIKVATPQVTGGAAEIIMLGTAYKLGE